MDTRISFIVKQTWLLFVLKQKGNCRAEKREQLYSRIYKLVCKVQTSRPWRIICENSAMMQSNKQTASCNRKFDLYQKNIH